MEIQKTLYNKELNVEFYHITKNAMTAIIKSLPLYWEDIYTLPKDRKIFAVLRNPVKRCVSGFLEIHKLYNQNVREHTFKPLDKLLENKIFRNSNVGEAFDLYINTLETNGFFDSHNSSQMTFLDGYTVPGLFTKPRKFDDITNFIKFENMDEGISKMINKQIKINKHNIGNQVLKNNINKILPLYENRIKKIYEKDLKLWEKR